MNSTFSRSLRTRHSRAIPKISLRALRLLRFRPSSLPRFAASDDGHFAPGELPARPQGACHAAREITVAVPDTSTQMNQNAGEPKRCEIIPVEYFPQSMLVERAVHRPVASPRHSPSVGMEIWNATRTATAQHYYTVIIVGSCLPVLQRLRVGARFAQLF